jgi:hypothetical protein
MNLVTVLPALAVYGIVMAVVSVLRGRRGAALVFGILAVGSVVIAVVVSYAPHSV